MPTLLVLNPNTTAAVTATLARLATAAAPAGGVVRSATARFGARYISDEVAAAIAGHAALDAYAEHVATQPPPDAVLLGCFGDPGLFALRALAAPVPVLGLAEAALQAAAAHGPFVVVTGGAAWGPMLGRLLPALALDGACLGVHTLELTGGELAAEPERAVRLLHEAARAALAGWPAARAVLLGGAGLAGLAPQVARLAPGLPVPVLDNVELALAAAWRAAASARPPSHRRSALAGASVGLAPELQSLLAAPAG
jgi:Asp/Glu/hydantoin racemase